MIVKCKKKNVVLSIMILFTDIPNQPYDQLSLFFT